MEELRFRQVHMDFHTSEKIMNVGEQFDPEEFADTLARAGVNSVTCFARCHHGMMYYDSRKFPELVHPGLKRRNILQEQIDACHRRGIKVPVYTTVQWDYHMSRRHPDWCSLTADGGFMRETGKENDHVFEPGFYRTLCVNNPEYRQFLKDHIQDIFDVLTPKRIDGLFLDIVNVTGCACEHCVREMQSRGFNPVVERDREEFSNIMLREFKIEMTAFIQSLKKDVTVFYNAGHIGPAAVDAAEAYTHWELESLPSGGWGYTHFPNTVRYARTKGKDYVSQTGKFHTMWGDFHSFKNPEALQYECFRMLAYNSKCLVGDQLHPDGKISQEVYELVGKIYREVEKKEPWCHGARAVTDIAVMTDERQRSPIERQVSPEINGVCMLLDELGYQFDIVDEYNDWRQYKMLIFPDTIQFSEEMVKKTEEYLSQGGHILATGKSGLDEKQEKFAVKEFGIRYDGEAPYSPDFIMPNQKIGKLLPKTEHVMYRKGELVEVMAGDILMDTYVPYFNRTWEHFCSHRHTPSAHKKGYPAAVQNAGCIYFAHPVFTIYQEKHPRWCREIIKDAIERLLPEPVIRHQGPKTMIVTLNEQKKEKRYILHALHYIPPKNCDDLYTIDDVIPLYQVGFSIKTEEPIKSAVLVPEGRTLPITYKEGRTELIIPEISGHAMVELNY